MFFPVIIYQNFRDFLFKVFHFSSCFILVMILFFFCLFKYF